MAGLMLLPVFAVGAGSTMVSVTMTTMNMFFFKDWEVKGIGYSTAVSYMICTILCFTGPDYLIFLMHPKQGQTPILYTLGPICILIGLICSIYSMYGLRVESNRPEKCMGYLVSGFHWTFVSIALFCSLVSIPLIFSLIENRRKLNNEDSKTKNN